MRVLTVRQPWAWAMFSVRPKDVENRSWTTDYRGPIAIHAATADAKREANAWPAMQQLLTHYGIAPEDSTLHLVRGAVIGVVDLVDIRDDSSSPWAMPGFHHWVLENPRRLPEPSYIRGQQGLRALPGGLSDFYLSEAAAQAEYESEALLDYELSMGGL